jgi:hypothetical protein
LDATDVTSLLLLEEAVAYHTLSAHTMVPTPSPNGNPPRGLPARHATVLAGDSVVSAGFGFYAVAFVFDLNGVARRGGGPGPHAGSGSRGGGATWGSRRLLVFINLTTSGASSVSV